MVSFNLGFSASLNHVSCFSSLGVSFCSSSGNNSDGTLRKLVQDSRSSIFKFMHQTVIVPKVCSPKNPSSWGSPPPPSLLEKLGEAEVFSIIFLQLHEYFECMKWRLQHHGTCFSLENKRLWPTRAEIALYRTQSHDVVKTLINPYKHVVISNNIEGRLVRMS